MNRTAAGAATPAAAAAELPTPVPTPPPTPLLVVTQQSDVIEAITAGGTPRWSFKPSTVLKTKDGAVGRMVAGSHLLLFGDDQVVVVDRGGVVVGHGTFTDGAEPTTTLAADPTGTRWTWSTIDHRPDSTTGGTGAADETSGSVWVAGIGEAPHRVQSWSEPDGAEVDIYLWSDRGIVTAVVPGACQPALMENSTAILDPATGRSTPLYGSDRHVVDVHHGLVLAMREPTTLLVSGVHSASVTEPAATRGEHLVDAAISPDGAHVYGSLTSESGCGGIPEVRTVVIDAASGRATILRDMYADGWYDDSHLVVHTSADLGSARGFGLRIVDLAGTGDGSIVTHGYLEGVMR